MAMRSTTLSQCAIFAALLAVVSQISIPFVTGVPFTLQTLMILLLGFFLGARYSLITTGVYLLIGALGFPVFANFSGGLPVLFGPTGGFLLSFPFMAALVGFTASRTTAWPLLFGATLSAILLNLLLGTLQFMVLSQISFAQALLACFWPFLLPELIKASLAVSIGLRLKHHAGIQRLVRVCD